MLAESYRRFEYRGAGCFLSGVEWGDPQKQAVIMLHGMRDHALSMQTIAECLAGDYYVIAPDLRGHGHSENPGAYTLVQFIADLRSLIEFKNLHQPILLGHSLGGHIVSRYAAIYRSEVKTLLLLDGLGPPDFGNKWPPEQHLDRMRFDITDLLSNRAPRQMTDVAEAKSRLMRNSPRLRDNTAEILAQEGVEPHEQGGVKWRWDSQVNMIWHSFSDEMTESFFRLIDCRVLLVTGSEALDYWAANRPDLAGQESRYEESLAHRASIFKQATSCVIESAGHMLQYDQPDALNRVVADFLTDVG